MQSVRKQYQVVIDEEREKMKNPVYFRLIKDEKFVGFKRVVTEFLPAGHNTWQLDPIEHNPDDTQILNRPAVGIENLKREGITSST